MALSQEPLYLSYNLNDIDLSKRKYNTYFLIDSYQKNESASNHKKGIYSFNLDNISKKTGNNKIGINHKLVNVYCIKLMDFGLPMLPIDYRPVDISLNFPFFSNFINVSSYTDTDYGGASVIDNGTNFKETKATQLLNMGKIYIGIKEFQSHSISNHKGYENIEFSTELKRFPYPYLYCKPLTEFEQIKLYNPVKFLNTLTIQFTNPDKELYLPKDVIFITPKLINLGDNTTNEYSTLRLGFEVDESITKDLLLVNGDRIIIDKFSSSESKTLFNGAIINTSIPTLDSHLNRKDGIYLDISNNILYPSPLIEFQTSTINGSPPTYNITINGWVDSLSNQLYHTATDDNDDQSFNKEKKKFKVFIPRNRIRIPMEIIGLKSDDLLFSHKKNYKNNHNFF